MTVTIAFPDNYALCFVPLFLSWIMNGFMTVQVVRARGRYDVKYPALYAPAGHKHERDFNSVQRSHQNTLETWSMVMVTMLATGLVYPTASALAGMVWVFGRFVYCIGYGKGGPSGRFPGLILLHFGDFPLTIMAGMIAWSVVCDADTKIIVDTTVAAVKGKFEL
eukprot:TRINITY_DN69023_c0_g1_i1.p1 TRINITY_DN69023_c0_g1~~TRINITY_DN69023_c0_g1_i1.p1  ORF type:complete len:185 (-),score=5.85 TRINITY_DN69023_c0_g1_i1:127-621(-)